MLKEQDLVELYVNQDLTMAEVAKVLNVSVATVHKYIKEYGIPSKPRMTAKAKEKISKANKGNRRAAGRVVSEETRKKLSASLKGRIKKPSKYGGHRKQRSDGYIAVYVPDHPYSAKDGYVLEHILVMEEKIGRYITRDEVVHHKNHIRNDNRIENLELMTFKEHSRLHLEERIRNHQINFYHVKVKNKTTGEIFSSVKEAANKYNVAATNISRACRHHERSVKGCLWEYVKEA